MKFASPLALVALAILLPACATSGEYVVREQCNMLLCYRTDAATGELHVDHVHRGGDVLTTLAPALSETQRIVSETCSAPHLAPLTHSFHGAEVSRADSLLITSVPDTR